MIYFIISYPQNFLFLSSFHPFILSSFHPFIFSFFHLSFLSSSLPSFLSSSLPSFLPTFLPLDHLLRHSPPFHPPKPNRFHPMIVDALCRCYCCYFRTREENCGDLGEHFHLLLLLRLHFWVRPGSWAASELPAPSEFHRRD